MMNSRRNELDDSRTLLVPHLEHGPLRPDRLPSYRCASWRAIQEKLSGVDSTNCRFVLRLRGFLDWDALLFAFEDLRRRHEVLTATVSEIDGRPWLIYAGDVSWAVERYDVSHLPFGEREDAARSHASAAVWRPMDITNGSLFRGFVVTLDREDHVLGFVVHHFIADTISTRILSEDLIRAYSLKLSGHRAMAQAESFQYRDYLLCANEWAAQPSVQRALREWTERFASAPPMDLAHRPAPEPTPDRACRRHYFDINAASTAAVASAASRLRTSKFVVLLAVQKMLLAALTNAHTVTMGAVVAGRELPILASIVGNFADRLHWITSMAGDPTFAEAVERVKDSHLHASQYQFFRYDMVQAELARRGRWLQAPVFNFMPHTRGHARIVNARFSGFQLDPAPSSTVPLPGISYWMNLSESARVMRGDIRLPHGCAERFIRQFLGVLEQMVKDHSTRLSAVQRALASP